MTDEQMQKDVCMLIRALEEMAEGYAGEYGHTSDSPEVNVAGGIYDPDGEMLAAYQRLKATFCP